MKGTSLMAVAGGLLERRCASVVVVLSTEGAMLCKRFGSVYSCDQSHMFAFCFILLMIPFHLLLCWWLESLFHRFGGGRYRQKKCSVLCCRVIDACTTSNDV